MISSNGKSSSVCINNGKVFIDGEEIPNPPTSKLGNSVINDNGKIIINGHKYDHKTKTFKFSLWAWIEHALS